MPAMVGQGNAYKSMKEQTPLSNEAKLSEWLRAARPTPELPPRFQENVWRRIEVAEQPRGSTATGWMDVVAAWVLRPRFALGVAALLVVTGVGLGWTSGERIAQGEAQARYVAAVAPDAFH